jgi:hypothetical protein
MMTLDLLTAALDQLAACQERLTLLDAREAGHFTAISERLAEITDLAARLAQAASDDADQDGYRPIPAPAWWKLTPGEREEPLVRLRTWVDQVYQPGYGHLAAALGPCWTSHDLCLYGLDILSELWSALYLQPDRTPGLLSAQAEYQARILPALAALLHAETTRCSHRRNPGPARDQQRSAR